VVTDDGAITVAGFDFPESTLLVEIYAQALTRAGYEVERAPALAPRELLMPGLERGLVEVVPEYEGSATSFLGGEASADETTARGELERLLTDRGLVAAAPADAQDRNAIVVRADVAADHGLDTLSDLAAVAPGLRFGGPPECLERDLCLPGLERRYGIRFEEFVPLDAGGPLTLHAIRAGFVDAALLFTTDPALVDGDLVTLEDDRQLQPSERVVPIVAAAVLDRFGDGVLDALDRASAGLTTEVLRDLNAAVQSGTPVEVVARRYLDAHPPTPDEGAA
jgi:osmoprotectant transport system substrate-binding protein